MTEPSTCEEKIYQKLFNQLVERLRSYLYYHCGNQGMAEDLTQEAFIKLWEHCQKVAPDKAKAFVYRVGYNLMLDKAKHQKVVQKFASRYVAPSGPTDPQYQIEEKEFEEVVWNTIRAMPEKSRVVFLLNRIDGMTYAEIADSIGISVKAVEKRMQKALQEIRKIYPD
jgi:RNA polymerase sigma-70 factor (family 1)